MNHHKLLVEKNALLHISCTGAGPHLQNLIWGTPGCSPYFAGFFTPYRTTQTHSFLGFKPEESYVSKTVAYDMAMASYVDASECVVMEDLEKIPVSIGISAAVATSRVLRGGYRAHVVVITDSCIKYDFVELPPGEGADMRTQHDRIIGNAAVGLLSDVLENMSSSDEDEAFALERFYEYPIFHTNGTRSRPPKDEKETWSTAYLPATLNPIHDGHREMCHAAEKGAIDSVLGGVISGKVRYLVSSTTPHKGNLKVQNLLFKAGMLRAERWRGEDRAVEFTRDEPLFIDKARKRRGCTFIIGADTMHRMLDPMWGPEIEPMLLEMEKLATTFLVMGRLVNDKWTTRWDVDVPNRFAYLFKPLDGRVDVSSTEIRNR